MLETIWFILWGVLWAVYFMLDGFDLGLGTLMPFLAKKDNEKRIIYNAMGPFWDGNEVWLITAGGVTFAAFPKTYAIMFSTLYSPLMLILFALILRGVSLEFRSKVESPAWRRLWDTCMFIGSFLPALLFGVAFANIFQGIPFNGEGIFQGNLFTLLNPYGLVGGVLFVMLFLVHGSLWLLIKTKRSNMHERTARSVKFLWIILVIIAVLFLLMSIFYTSLWDNYLKSPVFFLIPLVTVVALLMTRLFIQRADWWKAWFASAITIVTATFYGLIGIYPNLYPSSINSEFSLNIYNSSSSPLTLKIMLGIVIVVIPVVIYYQIWSYKTFKHPVTNDMLSKDESY